jgi:hypothetical protein
MNGSRRVHLVRSAWVLLACGVVLIGTAPASARGSHNPPHHPPAHHRVVAARHYDATSVDTALAPNTSPRSAAATKKVVADRTVRRAAMGACRINPDDCDGAKSTTDLTSSETTSADASVAVFGDVTDQLGTPTVSDFIDGSWAAPAKRVPGSPSLPAASAGRGDVAPTEVPGSADTVGADGVRPATGSVTATAPENPGILPPVPEQPSTSSPGPRSSQPPHPAAIEPLPSATMQSVGFARFILLAVVLGLFAIALMFLVVRSGNPGRGGSGTTSARHRVPAGRNDV